MTCATYVKNNMVLVAGEGRVDDLATLTARDCACCLKYWSAAISESSHCPCACSRWQDDLDGIMFRLASELTEDTMPLTLVEHVWGKKMTSGQGTRVMRLTTPWMTLDSNALDGNMLGNSN